MQEDELQGDKPAEEEMELSDDDEQPTGKKRKRPAAAATAEGGGAVKEQDLMAQVKQWTGEGGGLSAEQRADQDEAMDSMKCQLEAYKNEADLLRLEHKDEMDDKDQQMNIMRQTMQNVQKQMLTTKTRETALELQVKQLRTQMAKLKLKSKKAADGEEKKDAEKEGKSKDADAAATEEDTAEEDEVSGLLGDAIDGQDARLIGLAATFLNVHPEGASCDYLWSYLQQFPGYLALTARDCEAVLARYSRVFKENVSGVGARMERKWTFIGYDRSSEELLEMAPSAGRE